ncbi:hypothetical protein BDV98DRAFT_571878 [Pterulicium gracile]|uniref:Uncharacterized protein n=1 Tax=Pterulicium gracile TaxID=1884261 RepID=A0A5C3QGC5_9AGAR|nr:hypothetical protein BDV98DRAFT_571878 [Pterula gracilis]
MPDLPLPTLSSSTGNGSRGPAVAAIVGGVLGAFSLALLILVVYMRLRRRRYGDGLTFSKAESGLRPLHLTISKPASYFPPDVPEKTPIETTQPAPFTSTPPQPGNCSMSPVHVLPAHLSSTSNRRSIHRLSARPPPESALSSIRESYSGTSLSLSPPTAYPTISLASATPSQDHGPDGPPTASSLSTPRLGIGAPWKHPKSWGVRSPTASFRAARRSFTVAKRRVRPKLPRIDTSGQRDYRAEQQEVLERMRERAKQANSLVVHLEHVQGLDLSMVGRLEPVRRGKDDQDDQAGRR